jgi:hypothetical protein
MRRGFGLIGLVMTAILLVIVGVIAYNVGWSDGVATHLPSGTQAVAPPYYYGYGPHFWGAGFGIFGFFWLLFILFILFGLLRFAFFGRMFRGGGWGHGHGGGYGHRGVPPAIDEWMQEWHRRAHGEQPSSTTPPPPPPDQRSV